MTTTLEIILNELDFLLKKGNQTENDLQIISEKMKDIIDEMKIIQDESMVKSDYDKDDDGIIDYAHQTLKATQLTDVTGSIPDVTAKDIDNRFKSLGQNGNTSNRPTKDIGVGSMYFDTTLGKPIWFNGTDWVDSTGATV